MQKQTKLIIDALILLIATLTLADNNELADCGQNTFYNLAVSSVGSAPRLVFPIRQSSSFKPSSATVLRFRERLPACCRCALLSFRDDT